MSPVESLQRLFEDCITHDSKASQALGLRILGFVSFLVVDYFVTGIIGLTTCVIVLISKF
jgi:hypothetical protein